MLEDCRLILDLHVFPLEREPFYKLLKPFLINDELEVEFDRFVNVMVDYFASDESECASSVRSSSPRR